MKRRGFTLLELLIVVAIVGLLSVAISRAYGASLLYQRSSQASREFDEERLRFEDRLSTLLRSAILSATATDATSYFIATSSGEGTMNAGSADTLQFTTRGDAAPGSMLASQDDFETLNKNYGPQGGRAEVELSTTPVGDSAPDQQGLFLREQRPADGDPTQGGLESNIGKNVRTIGFEFYDGTQWQPTWDTQTTEPLRLPAAVRVTYTLDTDDVNKPRVVVIRLPLSDVTPDNPASQTTTAGGPQ